MTDEQRKMVSDVLEGRIKGNVVNLGGIVNRKEKRFAWVDFGNKDFCREVWQTLGKKCPNVETINFASNHIKTLIHFRPIKQFCPKLRNLSFEKNNLESLAEFDHFEDFKNNIHEIILKDEKLLKASKH